MAITAFSGPLVSFGVPASSTPTDYNSQRGPSLSDCGDALMDPRVNYGYLPGAGVTYKILSFFNNTANVDVILSSASSNALAISSNTAPVSGTAITITPSTAKDTKATTIVAPESGLTVSVTCLGSTAAYLTYGSDGTAACWNPAGIVGRAISITTSSSGDGGTYSIAGRDIYGFKVTESVTVNTGTSGSSGYTKNTVKAYKYISSILPTTTVTSTGVGIGLTDTIGMPWYAPNNGNLLQVQIVSSVSSNSGIVALTSGTFTAGTTAAQTATTADPRGTYASTTASNGVLRFQMIVQPNASAVQSVANSADFTGLFGQAQFSSV